MERGCGWILFVKREIIILCTEITLEMDPSETLPLLEEGLEAKASSPEAVSFGPEAEMACTEAVTVAPEAVTAGYEAEMAGSEAVAAGPEEVTAGSEAEMAGPETPELVTVVSEAVTEDTKAEVQSTNDRYRLEVILKKLIQDLRCYLGWAFLWKDDDTKAKELEGLRGLLQGILKRGAPEDPVSEDEQIAISCNRVRDTLKVIKGLRAESKKTNFMIRMALLTAAICYDAVESGIYWGKCLTLHECELDDPLLHIHLSYVLLKNEHKELFRKFLKCHGTEEVDWFNRKGVTALYVAIKNNNLEMVKVIIEQGANWLKVSQENDTALHAAVGYPKILKFLVIKHFIPEHEYYNNNGYTPIHLAVISKQLKQYKLIAEANLLYLDELVRKGKKTCLHLAVEAESVEIVEAIFERLKRTVGYRDYSRYKIASQVDENGHTPFHAALQGKNKDIIKLFLRNGAFLSEKGKDEETALEKIAHNFNDASDILCNALDDSISISTATGENTIHYSTFTDGKDMSQINVIENMVRCGHSDLLLHPVIKSYVYLKWNYFVPLFYVLISVHAIFLITFNVLVANIFYYRDTSNGTVVTNQTSNGTVPWFQLDWWYWTLITLMYAIFMVLIVQESFTIYIKRQHWRHHFADRETWMRLVFLVLAIILPVVLACAEPADWQRHVACAALLLGWLQAMFLLSRFPSWGSYVLMFGRVAINLLKILCPMLFVIIGFSFCFMIQYRSTPPFDGPVAAFFKTLVMMSSEFDYEDLFGEDHEKELRDTILIVRLLFLLFVVFVAIALMNFMTGAAVSDINKLTVMAEVQWLEKQVQLLDTIEAIVYEGSYANIFKKVFSRTRYYKYMKYSTIKVTKWKVITAANEEVIYTFRSLLNIDCDRSLLLIIWIAFVIFVRFITGVNIHEQSFEVSPSVELIEAFVGISRKKEWREEKKNVYITNNKIEKLHDAILDKPDDIEKENKDWVREVISKQEERMKSLAEDVSRANEQINSKIEKLISNQTQTSDIIKELLLQMKKMEKNTH